MPRMHEYPLIIWKEFVFIGVQFVAIKNLHGGWLEIENCLRSYLNIYATNAHIFINYF